MPPKKAPTASEAALRRFEERFTKAFGADSLHTGIAVPAYEVISTGSLVLDLALGVGGLVEGRITEYWGPDGAGKSTMALLLAAQAQIKHPKKYVGWVDMEHSIDKPWVDSHGVDRNRWYLHQPGSSEEVADAMKEMVVSDLFSVLVLDSIGGMVPEAEKEKDADQVVVGKQAGIVTRMVKILAVEAHKHNVAVLVINQVRANLAYGADTTTPGGFALKHVSTHKVKIRQAGLAKKMKVGGDEVEVGHEIACKIERNRVAPPGRVANIMLLNQHTEKFGPIGIDLADEAFTIGKRFKIIEQGGGGKYTLPLTGESVKGEDAAREALRADPALVAHIRTAALERQASLVREESEIGADVSDVDDEEKTPQFRTTAD